MEVKITTTKSMLGNRYIPTKDNMQDYKDIGFNFVDDYYIVKPIYMEIETIEDLNKFEIFDSIVIYWDHEGMVIEIYDDYKE